MKLLILTQYFPPEVGAPQNRLFELAVRLQRLGMEITVLTAMPNYPQMEIYAGYRGKSSLVEEMEGIKVYRSSIYVSKSKSIVNRLWNYFSFVYSSARRGKKIPGYFDFLICESPPLFLGYSAMYLARIKKAGLIFNVSDLWPESAEKLGVVTNKAMLSMAYRLEKKLYLRSVFVTGQTQGICRDIGNRFPNVKTYWLPNGVDLNYYDPARVQHKEWRKENGFSQSDIILLYAGIIGLAQGLEVILHAASAFVGRPEVKFVLMGSGPEKEKLLALKTEKGLTNVLFMDPVSKLMMPAVLKNVNGAIIPLRKLDLFLGAIPSKIFENLAMEVPILLGVDGEARELFINQAGSGLYFEPEDVGSLKEAITELLGDASAAAAMGKSGRAFVAANFNREVIAGNFYKIMKQISNER